MYNVQLTGYGKASVINYTKGGKPFRCEIIIQPIISKDMYGDNIITHLLGTLIKTFNVDTKDEPSSCSVSSDGRTEQEGAFRIYYRFLRYTLSLTRIITLCRE